MASTGKQGVKITADAGTGGTTGGSLRDWACPSYDVLTGRSASSLQEYGSGSKGNHTTKVSHQVDQTYASGQRGAPGVEGMNRADSGDAGRRKYGGSKLP